VTDITDRFRRVADRFSARAHEVPDDAWENPAPCDGWVARDVVRHMVEWMPSFIADSGGPVVPDGPSVDTDPAGAWQNLCGALQSYLDDDAIASSTISHPRAGTHRFDDAIATFFLGDVVIHTWDLARATGLDETLDADIVHDMLIGMEPMDEMLRASGQFGPRVEVPAGADEQTRLIAFTGRQP
jgi:uncharacterized protein (TIGR03086 family)